MTTNETTMTIQEKAQHFRQFFEQIERKENEQIWIVKDGSPKYIQNMCHSAHGDMFPDDWRYEFIVEALNVLSDNDDPDDINLEADIYTHDLLQWLSSRLDRTSYVDEAIENYGKQETIVNDIAIGQLTEKEEVLASVRSYLEDWETE